MMKTVALVAASVLASLPSRVVSHGATEPRPATDDWCINGTPLDIGECLCELQTEDACQGSACFRQMGLSWYRPSCKDCSCRPDPSAKRSTKSSPSNAQPDSVGKGDNALNIAQAAVGGEGECDSECSWKLENGEAGKSSPELPPTATNALDAGPGGAQASGAAGSGRSTELAGGGYAQDDNDQFEDGLEADDYLRLLGELETEAKSRDNTGNTILIAAAAVALAIVMMVVFRLAVPAPSSDVGSEVTSSQEVASKEAAKQAAPDSISMLAGKKAGSSKKFD
eukprot:INCI3218.1.p1 GENE.INCI3218.1~~INCI3218.1.p1  ORF type:complete len:282 (-),score=60.01 INCI3218.1:621-1466(-)